MSSRRPFYVRQRGTQMQVRFPRSALGGHWPHPQSHDTANCSSVMLAPTGHRRSNGAGPATHLVYIGETAHKTDGKSGTRGGSSPGRCFLEGPSSLGRACQCGSWQQQLIVFAKNLGVYPAPPHKIATPESGTTNMWPADQPSELDGPHPT